MYPLHLTDLLLSQVLASQQAPLPREAVDAGCDAAVTIVTQLGVDEYQQTKHNGGITTCSIKSTFAKRVVILASFLGGDHHESQKMNLATDPSAQVPSVFKQVEILMDKGFLVLDCSNSPLWGQARRVFIRIHPLLTSDWPSLLAMSSLGKLSGPCGCCGTQCLPCMLCCCCRL
jgi:hypothetical protein